MLASLASRANHRMPSTFYFVAVWAADLLENDKDSSFKQHYFIRILLYIDISKSLKDPVKTSEL